MLSWLFADYRRAAARIRELEFQVSESDLVSEFWKRAAGKAEESQKVLAAEVTRLAAIVDGIRKAVK
jgi:hypothetical protein